MASSIVAAAPVPRTMNGSGRQSAILPPIISLNQRISKAEEAERESRRSLPTLDTSAVAMSHPSSPYHAQRTYSDPFAASTNSSAAHSLASLSQRRWSGEEAEPASAPAPATRYSLPSLYEALGMDKSSPRSSIAQPSTTIPSRSTPLPENQPTTSHHSQQARTSSYPVHEQDQGPSWTPSRTPYIGRIGPASPVQKPARLHRESASTSPQQNQDQRPHGRHSIPYDHPQQISSGTHSAEPYHQSPVVPKPPYVNGSVEHPYNSSSMHPQPPPMQQPWHSNDSPRPPETKTFTKTTYSESVKRHLEVFDLEQSLNGVSDASKQLLEFSDFYRQKAHQTQRSGPLPGSTPHIQEIDEMMENGSRIQDALTRIREVVVNQQAALAERSREQALKSAMHMAEEQGPYHDDPKDGGYSGSDLKRRRGRAAPPGRCHSCNRAETPEWRRGPDGARTLCNACGLHYAKLTRKMGAGKASLGSSSLRPKGIESGTPVI